MILNYVAAILLDVLWRWLTVPTLIIYAVGLVIGQYVRNVLAWEKTHREERRRRSV